MQFLMDQAARYRGRFVEVSWTVPKSGQIFQLTAKFVPSQSQPTWMLYRGGGTDSELVWGHTSNDLTLMHNLVSLECEKAPDGRNAISANAMDNMVNVNRNAGALAGGLADSGKITTERKTTGQVQTRPLEKPTFSPSASPADTWLKNLQPIVPGQPPAAAGAAATPVAAATAAPSHSVPQPVEAAAPPSSEDTQIAIARGGTHELATLAAASLDGSLDGNLVNITVPKLLAYLTHKGSTGRLAIKSSGNACDVYIVEGNLTHAVSLDARGEFALLDAATWTDGEFTFKPLDNAPQQTLNMSSSDFVVACQGMLEYSRFFQQMKLHAGSYLHRTRDLTRPQFEQSVRDFGLIESNQLWGFLELMDGNRCLSDVLRLNPMLRAEWIPAMYTLLKSQLVALSEAPKNSKPSMFLEGAQIDQPAIDSFMAAIADPEDGALRRQAFLYLLQQEHFRYERSGVRYALALFNFGTTQKLDTTYSPFSKQVMKLAVQRINAAKRKLDVIGHFDNTLFALLLPETDSAGAAVFAHRICDLITRPPITPELANESLVASFGIASVPNDVRDLSALLAAAKTAHQRSKMMGAPVCLYDDAK